MKKAEKNKIKQISFAVGRKENESEKNFKVKTKAKGKKDRQRESETELEVARKSICFLVEGVCCVSF